MMTDYMWAASGVARVAVTRNAAIGELISVRGGLRRPPSWTAMFVKAFALVAVEVPELRRAYLRFPWAHLYEFAESTACVMQAREFAGDVGVLPIRLRKPEGFPLSALTDMIRIATTSPIEDSRFNKALIAISRLPVFLRRLIWIVCLNIPRLRRHSLGTYAVSSAARWQAELGTSRTPLPCLLSYGASDREGNVRVRLSFDHRIFDGALAGRILSRLDEVLNTAILEELRQQAKREAGRGAVRNAPGSSEKPPAAAARDSARQP